MNGERAGDSEMEVAVMTDRQGAEAVREDIEEAMTQELESVSYLAGYLSDKAKADIVTACAHAAMQWVDDGRAGTCEVCGQSYFADEDPDIVTDDEGTTFHRECAS